MVDVYDLDNSTVLINEMWVMASAIKGGAVRIPKSYEQAMRNPELWEPAMQSEIQNLEAHECWQLVDLPEGANLVDGMWVFDLKMDDDGNIVKPKARYVGQGDSQIPGIDFDKGWAMVTRVESVQMAMAVAAVKQLVPRQFDFSSAYLNGVMDRPLYMNQRVLPSRGRSRKCV